MEASSRSSLSEPIHPQETTLRRGLGFKRSQDGPCWANLLPDILAKVFTLLRLQDILTNIPLVCRAWQHASHNAICWQNVDLSEWSIYKPETMERMLSLVIHRSQGGLRAIYAPRLRNDKMLNIITSGGSKLQVLQMPNSGVSESCLINAAPMFPSLEFLDISGRSISSGGVIEAFGKNCGCITRLNVNMGCTLSHDVAAVIGQHMPQLKHLEIANVFWTNKGLSALLEKCTSLERIDLGGCQGNRAFFVPAKRERGCWHLHLEESFLQDAMKNLKVFLPLMGEDDYYDG